MANNKPPKITVRGIRTQIPPGYLLGRTAPGGGPVQLISAAGARAAIGLTPGYIQTSVNIQKLLDGIGAVQGDILYRDATGWKVLSPGTAGNALTTGGPAANPAWSALDIQSLLNTIGTTQGDILYRNATAWVVLAPGVAGQVLATGGASANPGWIAGPSKGTLPLVTGDLPGPALVADGRGQCIAVPL